ncbi:hypothetical protein PENTCL1PPCAC_4115, partial [Pristionchus entomophagus]
GVRTTGLMDCASIGAARRALDRIKIARYLFSEWSSFTNQRFDSFKKKKCIHFLSGGFGFLPISNNVLECSNSWDMGREKLNWNLNDCIEKIFQSVRVGLDHMSQAPFGGGDLIVKGKPVIRKVDWDSWTTAAKESYLKPIGMSLSKMRKTHSELPHLILQGQTQGEF